MTAQGPTQAHVLIAILDLLGKVAKKVDAIEARSKGRLPSQKRRKRHIKAHVRTALAQITERTAGAHGRTVEDMLGQERDHATAHARQACMTACRDAGHTIEDIALFMCRDTSTVQHGIKAHRKRVAA